MFRKILVSLSITAAIATALASIFYFFFHISFLGTFSLSFLLQIMFFYIYYGSVNTKNALEFARLENERFAEFAKQGALIQCAYCQHKTFQFLRFDINNNFECPKCKKLNAVYISIETAQITEPVNGIKAIEVPQENYDDPKEEK